jgi:hypothetical protein
VAKRALLIGSETYGLGGVNSDVQLMAETLERRGFEVRRQIDREATRGRIIEGYERLIADTPEGSTDPVVVYYSGHGSRGQLPDWEERARRGAAPYVHFVVPFDMESSNESDFRGILAEELSDLQRRLTERTSNVTIILDCCHSGTMSRDLSVFPKAVTRGFPIEGARAWLEQFEDRQRAEPAVFDDSNQLAVRVVACDPSQSAYERLAADGQRHGALTEQLASALETLGDRAVSWRVLGDRIRRTITATLPMQRPEIEGPADRVLFSLRSRTWTRALPVTVDGGAATINAARLLGVSEDDTYMLIADDETEVGTAKVMRVDSDRAQLEVTKGSAASAVSAVPTRTHDAQPIRVDVTGHAAQLVAEAVRRTSSLRLATDGDTVIATISGDDGLAVSDAIGRAVNAQRYGLDAVGVGHAIDAAERIAKATRLRTMTSTLARGGSLAGAINVELATHDDHGRRTARAAVGERLYVRDRVSITMTNQTDRVLYVAAFDVTPGYNIVMLNRAEPSGWKLAPGELRTVGGQAGVPLEWSPTVPADDSRLESIVVIAATAPQEFALLQTPGAMSRGEAPSELEALLGEARSGTRDFPAVATSPPAVAYLVTSVDFTMVPTTRPDLDEPPFTIREMHDITVRTMQPRALVEPPSRVAVRLTALKVHKNRALFKAAVRLDAMIITKRGEQVVATPFTAHFPGIADGDLLPMDNLLIFLDDVNEFLDVAIWVNRDDTKGADLAALFEKAAHAEDTKNALVLAGALIVAAPQMVGTAAAIASVASLVRVGASLIQAAVGKDIGLYRTSFLAFEQYGLGRQPRNGFREAQSIEFAYEILEA